MTQTRQEAPNLPTDLYSHMQDMDPRSHAFKEELGALNALALETGHLLLTPDMIIRHQLQDPPIGYESNTLIPGGSRIPLEQFGGVIHSFSANGEYLISDVQQLVTDTGKTIRLCDLRGSMSSNVRKGGPESTREREGLDRVVYKDIKFLAETGHAKLSVHDVRGVCYSRLGDTKVRAYWMPIRDELAEKGSITIARIADSGNSVAAEADLYRRVFQKKL